MPIKVQGVSYVRYQVPDLDLAEHFMTAFGLRRSLRTDHAVYLRGAGPEPFIYVAERVGEGAAPGFGLCAQSEADLERVAYDFGVPVQASSEPGGGSFVRLTDPAGFDVRIVAGCSGLQRLDTGQSSAGNQNGARNRVDAVLRTVSSPSHVLRLGHVVLKTPNADACFRFYADNFGMLVSDSYYAGDPANVIGRFLRCDRGTLPTDHHSLALLRNAHTSLDHSAFEVRDMTDLVMGNAHLAKAGFTHEWGIGRHVEGSQLFDYWRDPFGNKIEHWTDGDLLTATYEGGATQISTDALAQWAPTMPETFLG